MTIQTDPIFNAPKVSLPYNGTAGYSAEGASTERAHNDVRTGRSAQMQSTVLQMLAQAGPMGRTAAEIEKATGQGHGRVSGALSALHKDGKIAALKLDRRNGHGVYVALDQIGTRLPREFKGIEKNVTVVKAPAAPARPRLTTDEVTLFATIEAALGRFNDKPAMPLKPSTVKTMLDALKRMSA